MSDYLNRSVLTGLLTAPFFSQAYAQITHDGSLGPAATLSGPHYWIETHRGALMGNNLFHSFGEFNINTGESATFTGPSHIANIIGRVTSGSLSTIDGALNSTIPNANLYLLNPSGVMMGPNARLNIDGSFHLSSADYLRFADGQQFGTHSSAPPILSVAAPEAFGFLDNKIGNLIFDGNQLSVSNGRDLSLVGGDIQIEKSTLSAPGGHIQITSVASAGEVVRSDVMNNTLLQQGNIVIKDNTIINVGNQDTQRGGAITIQGGQLFLNNSTIDTLGKISTGDIRVTSNCELQINNSQLQTQTTQGQAGSLTLTAQQMLVANGLIDTATQDGQAGAINVQASERLEILGNPATDTGLWTSTKGEGKGGDITVNTPRLDIMGNGSIVAKTEGTGDAGNITLNVTHLEFKDGGRVNASSTSAGRGGDITVQASERLEILGNSVTFTGLWTLAKGEGKGGDITVNTPRLNIIGNAGIAAQTDGTGNAGNITLKVTHLEFKDGGRINASTTKTSTGNGGNITVDVADSAKMTGYVSLSDGDSQPSAIGSSAYGSGDSGTIRITVGGALNLDKHATIQTLARGHGKAGDIVINVKDLTITQGADIDASNEGTGQGKGGNIEINATGQVLITAKQATNEELSEFKPIVKDGFLGGIYSVAGENGGVGGDVSLSAGRLELREGGTISVGSLGLGNAGDLTVDVGGALVMDNAAIITRSIQAGGGDIDIGKPAKIHLFNSKITAEAQGSKPVDKGGNILIKNRGLFTLDNSQLLANAYAGNGGKIDINTPKFNVLGNNRIDFSSELGFTGEFWLNKIKFRDNFLTLSPPGFQDIELSLSRCAGLTRDNLSSFFVISRDVLPPAPGDLTTDFYIPED
jgi:filamentous hemagglutinin family protein